MPYAADIDMTVLTFNPPASRGDPSPGTVGDAGCDARHWLLDTVYGRDLLKAKLRIERPDLDVPEFRQALHLYPLLDQMIDKLALRHWRQPTSLGDLAL